MTQRRERGRRRAESTRTAVRQSCVPGAFRRSSLIGRHEGCPSQAQSPRMRSSAGTGICAAEEARMDNTVDVMIPVDATDFVGDTGRDAAEKIVREGAV